MSPSSLETEMLLPLQVALAPQAEVPPLAPSMAWQISSCGLSGETSSGDGHGPWPSLIAFWGVIILTTYWWNVPDPERPLGPQESEEGECTCSGDSGLCPDTRRVGSNCWKTAGAAVNLGSCADLAASGRPASKRATSARRVASCSVLLTRQQLPVLEQAGAGAA